MQLFGNRGEIIMRLVRILLQRRHREIMETRDLRFEDHIGTTQAHVAGENGNFSVRHLQAFSGGNLFAIFGLDVALFI